MQSNELVSLVVATLGRHVELVRLLESLTQQTYHDFEVVVVDQNPEAYLADVKVKYSSMLKMRWVRCSPHGVSAARNVGISEVSPDAVVLGFPDDDCWYEPDTVEQVVASFRRHKDANAIMGQWCGVFGVHHDGSDRKVGRYSVFSRSGTLTYFLVKRGAWPLYDESLGPGSGLPFGGGEDTDYLLSVLSTEGVIFRTPSVRLRHPDDSSNYPWPKLRSYAMGRQYLLMKWHFAWWFQAANMLYPLVVMMRHPKEMTYRLRMFAARLVALWRLRSTLHLSHENKRKGS